jgi:hypothetical protein
MPGTHFLRHAGLDKPDEKSEIVERLDGFGGSGDQRFGGGRGEWLDDEILALPDRAELREFGGGDFLPQGQSSVMSPSQE